VAVAAPRLVVLRALGLGDLLTAVPALRALADAFPGHRLVLGAPASLAPLALATGAVDEVVGTDLRAAGGPAPDRPLDPRLRGADVAVNLHGRGPQSHRLLLALDPGRLIAFAHPQAAADGPLWRDDEHEVPRWCRLLSSCGIASDPRRLGLEVDADPLPGAAGATLLHPGAAAPARRWPLERWAAVARVEHGAGRRVLVTGGPGEVEDARRVASAAGLPGGSVVAGRTDLLGLAATVAAAGRVVCGDTGVAHLATAVGTPSVVLFGPVPPDRWGPPADRPQHRALWAGRTGDPHADVLDPGLASIDVPTVLAALADLAVPVAR
jgi:ADP-heptose:LPS heptosyltransferase